MKQAEVGPFEVGSGFLAHSVLGPTLTCTVSNLTALVRLLVLIICVRWFGD